MLSKSLLLLATAALALATPIRRGPGCSSGTTSPALPKTGGSKELPNPTNSSLKAIVLGFGIQNYTCSGAGAEAKASGALAMLYDVTDLYPGQSTDSLTLATFNALTSVALWTHEVPLNLLEAKSVAQGADSSNPFPADASLKIGNRELPYAGHHFFNAGGAPQFVISTKKAAINIVAAKLDDAPAPSYADKGPSGTGAVAWLYLGQSTSTKSTGAKYVYRVNTAGGNPATCSGEGTESMSYTTQYWLYD